MSTDIGMVRRVAFGDTRVGRSGFDEDDPIALASLNEGLDDDVSNEENDPTNLEDEQGWEDVEPDIENIVFKSLFDDRSFLDVHSMLQYCLTTYQFDFVKVRNQLGLDFLESIKFTNYIRAEVLRGTTTFKITSKQLFENNKYLQPVLEDDALLYSLDDLEPATDISDPKEPNRNKVNQNQVPSDEMVNLRRKLQRTVDAVKDRFRYMRTHMKRRSSLQADSDHGRRFSDPENSISVLQTPRTALDNFCQTTDVTLPFDQTSRFTSTQSSSFDSDIGYKQAYADIRIHETMIKDAIRTNAYKDFIYNNAHLFKGKIVLDVGCGSGILSLFCAKAGAKMVYAVDQSEIVYKAIAVAYDSKLSDIIHFRHGSIENMTEHDIPKVDIIVSEWMGFGLLYESMLDSVILARDKFLKPNGIVLPSHASIYIAPVHDPQYHAQKVGFWSDVHGFDMSAMAKQAYSDAIIRTMDPPTIIGSEYKFLDLDLKTCRKANLEFSAHYKTTLNVAAPSISGYTLWFDVTFAPPGASKPETLTTSPFQPVTHWEQVYLMIDPECKGKILSGGLPMGTELEGTVRYTKREENKREVEIRVRWEAHGHGCGYEEGEEGAQEWT
ncbi:hypothetical protein MMC11_006321, partial [Xylographa trunciseda]|nr:hypothetical protein [Xylographa trunciseda]